MKDYMVDIEINYYLDYAKKEKQNFLEEISKKNENILALQQNIKHKRMKLYRGLSL